MNIREKFISEISRLGINPNEDAMMLIIDDIFIKKQFLQSHMRTVKQKNSGKYAEFLKVLLKYKNKYLSDLIIVSDEDAVDFK